MGQEWIDRSKPVRPGEELDADKLTRYFREHVPEIAGDIEISQFPSGFSNLTYLLSAGGKEYVLRRPPFGNKEKTAHDMGREFRVLSKLNAVYGPAPRAMVFCEDPSVMGCPFYVMERRRGVILRQSLPRGLDLSPLTLRALCESFIDNLVAMHSVDYEKAGLADLGKPAGYVERQIKGWARRYEQAHTDDVPAMVQVADWLDKNRPAEVGTTLIHNDYKFDNIVLDVDDITRVIGVLDWEMATIGDPLMDLGTTVGYWIQADDPPALQAFVVGPTRLEGAFTRKELIERYAERSGRSIENPLFYFVFGIYKLAVIVQQIYYRYHQGLTKDERFAHLNFVVQMLAEGARDRIEVGSI
ncbi:phosphotransferase family protein [bacterium]|jgi:aminoglycoside phosphotransferase (APT) family kinase protein|nr:phosphotransferase family protein [bacterium]